MTRVTTDNKRILKNTILLYVRMAISMLVGLYTTRVVLEALGVVDYGIFNVVGGVVAMCAVVSNTLSSASQRFFSFEIGRKEYGRVRELFSATVVIYWVFSLIILILAETIGLWLVNFYLVYPPERYEVVMYVYQFSILSFILGIIRVPYNSMVIAEEKMDFFAWISIIDVFARLGVTITLLYVTSDRLIFYALLLLIVTMLITIIYYIYCKAKFAACNFYINKNRADYKTLLSFAGWNTIGTVSNVAMDQGVNFVLNVFCGPAVNAARAVAITVKSATAQFATNIQMASTPQLVKYYSAGEKKELEILLFRCSKLAFFLFFIVSLPIMLNVDYILILWLKEVPEWTPSFTILALVIMLVECLSGAINVTVQATGHVKWYNILIGSTYLLAVPLVFVFLSWGATPLIVMIVPICLGWICLWFRLFLLQKYTGISSLSFLKNVVCVELLVVLTALVIPVVTIIILPKGIVYFVVNLFISSLCAALACAYVGLTHHERKYVFEIFAKKIAVWKKQK